MKRAATDQLILMLIALPVCALMLLTPRDNLRVERNWGEVFYSPPVQFQDAAALADLLVDQGLFVGTHLSLKLVRKNDVWQLMMVYKRDYEELIPRETLTDIAYQLCALAFPGKTASLVLVDPNFEPFDELVPPTPFPEIEEQSAMAPAAD